MGSLINLIFFSLRWNIIKSSLSLLATEKKEKWENKRKNPSPKHILHVVFRFKDEWGEKSEAKKL